MYNPDDEFERKMLDMDIPLKHFISNEEKETCWKEILTAVEKPRRAVRLLKTVTTMAATFVLIILVLTWQWNSDTRFRTAQHEKLHVDLADGSNVTINASSSVILSRSFGAENRTLRLDGEAFFKVKKNTSLPFIVNIGSSEIVVTGTSFNIHYRRGEGYVSVRSGSVKVRSATGMAVLREGEKLHISNDGSLALAQWDENDLAWYSGTFVIKDKSLGEVAAMLSKLFSRRIEVSEKVASCRISARIKYETIADILDVIDDTLGTEWKEESTRIYLYGKGC